MKIMRPFGLLAMCCALAGCVSVFEGTSQEINVVTNPVGASCTFEREGMTIGRISNTPGVLTVRKSKYDITVRCDRPGYQEAAYLNHSGVSAAIAANIAADLIFTAGISSIVDSANGADNKYDSVVNISMIPNQQVSVYVPPATTGVAPAPAPNAASFQRYDEK